MLSAGARKDVLDHPELFLLHYFPEWIGALKDFHLDLIHSAAWERRSLTLFPATHGKTTLFELLPIWAICRDPNIRIAGIFKNEADGRAVTRAMMSEMTSNDELIQDFGPFRNEEEESKTWTQSRFDVAGRTRGGKSSTWAAFGAGSRHALGYRTDWTIIDDCVTDVNSNTPEQRAKLRAWFNQGPMTMPDSEDGRISITGTVFHPEDLYHDLMRMRMPDTDEQMWKIKIRQAILDPEKKKVLWPEARPYRMLMEEKLIMGTLDFNKRFQNIAVDPSGLVFREEYLYGGTLNGFKYPGCLDEGYRLGDLAPEWRVYCGFDPAIGMSRHRKFCAHITLAVGSCPKHERCLWLVDLARDQMTLPQQVDLLLDRHARYRASKTMIETNGYQTALLQHIKDKMHTEGLSHVMEPHYTTRMNKPDPHAGVSSMSAMVERGELHIPWGDSNSRRLMQNLIDEMVTYPDSTTTDCVMALWFAYLAARLTAPVFKTFNRLDNYQVRWPDRSGQPWGTQVIKNPVFARE